MVMRSLASFSEASAQTSRHAGFGMIVACDECTSLFGPRTRSSKYAMPLRPRLIVGRPAALDRLERRGLPLVLGIRGLDVVMVVDEERAGAGPGLADDRRRTVLRAQRLRRDTGTSCAREHRRGGLVDRALVSGHRRKTDERF